MKKITFPMFIIIEAISSADIGDECEDFKYKLNIEEGIPIFKSNKSINIVRRSANDNNNNGMENEIFSILSFPENNIILLFSQL